MISIGDKVRVVGYCSRGRYDADGEIGIVKSIFPTFYIVQTSIGNIAFRYSQVSKVVEPREFWIGAVKYENPHTLWYARVAHEKEPKEPLDDLGEAWIHVVEVSKISKTSNP